MHSRGSSLVLVANVAFVSGLVLSACSSNSSSTSPSGSGGSSGGPAGGLAFDPCALLTFAEIQPIVDKAIVAKELHTDEGGGDIRCNWNDQETFTLLTVLSHGKLDDFETVKTILRDPAITGVGEEAYLSGFNSVYVKVKGKTFFAQSLRRVKDGNVSAEVHAAGGDEGAEDLERDEGSYRLAKIVAAKL